MPLKKTKIKSQLPLTSKIIPFFTVVLNFCSAIQLWHATDEDDQICSIEKLESAILGNNNIESCCSLVFVGHVSGYISLLKGEGE